MSGREELDKKNITKLNNLINRYPDILHGYISSISGKTSYTKLYYAKYICNFLDYLKNNLHVDIYDYAKFNNIKPMHIDSYMDYIKYNHNGDEKSGTFRAAQLAAIKGFFGFLKRNDIIIINPCDPTEIPKDKNIHEITTISDKDMDIIMHNIEYGVGSPTAIKRQKKWKSRDKALILLGITTGIRMGAILGIDIDDIDFDKQTIQVVEKGDKKRIVFFGQNTSDALQQWINDRKIIIKDSNERALFISSHGTRLAPTTMEDIMKRVTTGIDKNITPHKMRATCATRLYEQTGDIYLVQQQLGHKSIKNTERYAKVSNERKIQAANILDSIF